MMSVKKPQPGSPLKISSPVKILVEANSLEDIDKVHDSFNHENRSKSVIMDRADNSSIDQDDSYRV